MLRGQKSEEGGKRKCFGVIVLCGEMAADRGAKQINSKHVRSVMT